MKKSPQSAAMLAAFSLLSACGQQAKQGASPDTRETVADVLRIAKHVNAQALCVQETLKWRGLGVRSSFLGKVGENNSEVFRMTTVEATEESLNINLPPFGYKVLTHEIAYVSWPSNGGEKAQVNWVDPVYRSGASDNPEQKDYPINTVSKLVVACDSADNFIKHPVEQKDIPIDGSFEERCVAAYADEPTLKLSFTDKEQTRLFVEVDGRRVGDIPRWQDTNSWETAKMNVVEQNYLNPTYGEMFSGFPLSNSSGNRGSNILEAEVLCGRIMHTNDFGAYRHISLPLRPKPFDPPTEADAYKLENR